MKEEYSYIWNLTIKIFIDTMKLKESSGVEDMKMNKSITSLGKAIGFESFFGCIITVVLITGVIFGIFKMENHYEWSNLIRESKGTYEYTAYNDSYIKGVEEEIADLYKNSRVLYSYSDIDNLSLENLSSESIMIYAWDESNSKKLDDSITSILQDIEVLMDETSFKVKEKRIIVESLEMIRYFCDNQQVMNKVRLEMKLTGELTQSSSNLNIEIIGEGGKEYLKEYGDKLTELKNIFV